MSTLTPTEDHHGREQLADSNVATTTRWVGTRRALPAAGFVVVCAAASFTELSAEEGQVFCPYRLLTGGWCPGCGCTRALKALVRGDVRDSLAMNPWTLVLFAQALIVSVAVLVTPARTMSWLNRNKVAVAILNIFLALGFWAARLVAGEIPLPFT